MLTIHTHTHTHTHTHPAYHQLMLHTDTNEENLSGFLKLLDMALQHEVRCCPLIVERPTAWFSYLVSELVWGVGHLTT